MTNEETPKQPVVCRLEATIRELKYELAEMTLQRDRLLEMTWLDGPGEPWESTAGWKDQFEAGWVRRAAADDSEKAPAADKTAFECSALVSLAARWEENARELLAVAIEQAEELRQNCSEPVHEKQLKELRSVEAEWAGSKANNRLSDP